MRERKPYVERRGHNLFTPVSSLGKPASRFRRRPSRKLASELGSHLAGLLSVQRVNRITAEDESW